MVSKTVKSLNALPRPSRVPSSSIPNDWFFDVRYIPLEPTPHHILFLIRPEDKFVHTERLPLGLSSNRSGIAYFPELADEAAPELANALIHSFVNNFGKATALPPSAPWKLITHDPALAIEIEKEFRKLGVREELCRIQISKRYDSLAQSLCDDFFQGLKRSKGITGMLDALLDTPQSIGFYNFRPPADDHFIQVEEGSGGGHIIGDVSLDRILGYTREFMNSRCKTTDFVEDLSGAVHDVLNLFQSKSVAVVRAEADAGNPESAIDYAFR